MPTTTNLGIIYPDSSGNTQLWGHFQNLAESVDTAIGDPTCIPHAYDSATARDAIITVPVNGQLAYLRDTKKLTQYDGTQWVILQRSTTTSAIWLGSYSGTTDASGFLTVSHAAAFTPFAVFAVTTNPSTSFAAFWGADNFNASTVRLRFMHAGSAGPLATTAVQGKLMLLV